MQILSDFPVSNYQNTCIFHTGGVSGDITVILGLVISDDEIRAVELTEAQPSEHTSRLVNRRRVHRWSESDLESILSPPILRSASHSVPRQQP